MIKAMLAFINSLVFFSSSIKGSRDNNFLKKKLKENFKFLKKLFLVLCWSSFKILVTHKPMTYLISIFPSSHVHISFEKMNFRKLKIKLKGKNRIKRWANTIISSFPVVSLPRKGREM